MALENEDLCVDCGLCCDGSLFWAVPLPPGETAVMELDPEHRLRQPCACFDGKCTVYADRPSPCREFDCRVLQTLKAGKQDAKWARAQIDAMRRLTAQLERLLPLGGGSVYRRAAEYIARHRASFMNPEFQRGNRQLLSALSAYEHALKAFHVTNGKT